MVSVPLSCTLLGADVQVGAFCLEGVDSVRGQHAASVAGGQRRKDFTRAQVFSSDAVAFQTKIEHVAHNGDGCVGNAVDAGGTPRLKPGVVGDVVTQDTSVFGGDVGHATEEHHVTEEGCRQSVGGIVGGARSRTHVKESKGAAVKGERQVVSVADHGVDGCAGGVTSVGSVPCGGGSGGGVELHDHRCGLPGCEEIGSVGGQFNHAFPVGRPRGKPNSVVDVVA